MPLTVEQYLASADERFKALRSAYPGVFVASAFGDIPYTKCDIDGVDMIGLVRVAITQFNQAPSREWYWTDVELPRGDDVLHLYFVRIDPCWIAGVVAPLPPRSDRKFDDQRPFDFAAAVLRYHQRLIRGPEEDTPEPPFGTGSPGSGPSGAEALAGLAGGILPPDHSDN